MRHRASPDDVTLCFVLVSAAASAMLPLPIKLDALWISPGAATASLSASSLGALTRFP